MTIKIADQPILVDIDCKAQAWLDRFMPESTIFRPPQVDLDQYLSGADGNCNGAFFKSSLPELPPIKIGQIQWPCVGASRYARGLFLVDRVALFEILHEAWGQAVPEEFPYAIPDDWTQTKNRPVSVFLANTAADGSEFDFAIWLYLLMPIRITDDLWLLPLVDGRYFRLTDCKKNEELNEVAPTKTWQDLFNGLSTGIGTKYKIYVDYADDAEEEMGYPDTVCCDPQVPTPFVVDVACFSIGRRPLVPFPTDMEVDFDFPEDSQLGVIAQKSTDAATTKTATLGNSIITGGVSSTARRPRSISVATWYARQFYSGTNDSYSCKKDLSGSPRNGVDLFCKAVWNTLDDDDSKAAFEDYVTAIAGKLNAWNTEEYYCVFPDLIPIDPSGFDDYIVFECSGEKKTTTVRSLPIDFVSPFLIAQAPSGPDFDSTTEQTKWFRTSNQTVMAKLREPAGMGGVTSGFRDNVTCEAQIIDGALLMPSGSPAIPPPLAMAKVTCVNGEERTLEADTIVHLVWMDCVLWDAGDPYGSASSYEGWVIDWADCDG